MEFSFSQAKDGKKFLGLMGKKRRVVCLKECFLVDPWFTRSLVRVFDWWTRVDVSAYHPRSNRGVMRTLTMRYGVNTHEKMVMLTISEEMKDFHLNEFKELFYDVDTIILRKQISEKKQATRFEERILKGSGWIYENLYDANKKAWKFKIRSGSFFQPNTKQAEIIYREALKWVKGEEILDLYSGIGVIGILASQKVKKVIGMEIVLEAVMAAKENIKENNITNMDILQGDVEKLLEDQRADTIIVDPPRVGISQKTIEKLKDIRPKRIIYISCNPRTQVENCFELPYKIISLQPIDQFPHTPHLENIAVLELI